MHDEDMMTPPFHDDPWDNIVPEYYDINDPDAVDFDPFHDLEENEDDDYCTEWADYNGEHEDEYEYDEDIDEYEEYHEVIDSDEEEKEDIKFNL